MSTLSDGVRTLSYEAALYFYPLVMMDVTRLQSINTPAGTKEGFGPPNEFHHFRAFPTADMRAVVRPNFDTLYSMAWLDLTAGPVIMHAPDTDDRYYMLPLLDMWTDVFATLGKRTTGTDAQDFVISAPGYAGDLPEGLAAIAASTPYVWIIGRTQTNGPADYDAVHEVQDGYRISPVGKPVDARRRRGLRHQHRAAQNGQQHERGRLLHLCRRPASDQSAARLGLRPACPHREPGHRGGQAV